jgi:glutathione S-transferase
MSLKIYGIAASRASRPLWVAHELGLDYEHIATPYAGGATRTPEFLQLNPNGHIPVVDDHGVIVWESMACALYLAQRYPLPGGGTLSGVTPAEQAEVLRWTFWTVTECEKDALAVLMHSVVMPPDRRKPELAQESGARLQVPLQVLEQHLAAGRAYVAGERFTVADICVASVLAWLLPVPALLASVPHVQDWLKRCMAREAQQQVRALSRKA